MNFLGYTEDEIKRYCALRAIEWGAFPAYVSQFVAPFLFVFYPWYAVLIAVIILEILWLPVRHAFVSVELAGAACVAVTWLKWPIAIGSSIYLFAHHRPGAGIAALLWPVFATFSSVPAAVVASLTRNPIQLGDIESAFAKRIGEKTHDRISNGYRPMSVTATPKKPPQRPPSEARNPPGARKKMSTPVFPQIVLLDDDTPIREILEVITRDSVEDGKLLSFGNGDDALRELMRADPDLFITDWKHLGATGEELLSILTRAGVRYPVFVISGSAQERDIQEFRRQGLNVRLIPKPFAPERLHADILRLFSQ